MSWSDFEHHRSLLYTFVGFRTLLSDFRLFDPISDAIVCFWPLFFQFQTLLSDFERFRPFLSSDIECYRPFLDTFIRLRTFFSDFGRVSQISDGHLGPL